MAKSEESENGNPIVYEVLFSGREKAKDGDDVVVGPARVQARNTFSAIVMAAIEKYDELKNLKPTSIRVKSRGF